MAHVDPEHATKQPTPEEAAAIAAAGGDAAGKAAESGKTAEQAQADQEAAMKAKAAEGGIALSDEAATKIAETTIKMLEARGAFEQATPPAPATPPSSGEGSEQPAAQGSEASQPASEQPASSSPPAGEQRPRKRTFAERFQGKS